MAIVGTQSSVNFLLTFFMRLSKSAIDNLCYRGREIAPGQFSQDIQWDDSITTFGVRVYPNGTKAFVISYRFRGQQRIRSLGRYGRVTFDQAKKDAKIKLALASQGQDPFAERDKNNRGMTFGEVAEEHLLFHAQLPPEKRKKTLYEDERRIRKILIPAWGSRKIGSLEMQDVAKLHHLITVTSPLTGAPAPYEENRVLKLISVIFKEAIRWGYYADRNPTQGIPMNPEEKRDRWGTKNEIQRILAAIESEDNIYAGAAIKLYLLLGVRKSELLNAKWEDMIGRERSLSFHKRRPGEPTISP